MHMLYSIVVGYLEPSPGGPSVRVYLSCWYFRLQLIDEVPESAGSVSAVLTSHTCIWFCSLTFLNSHIFTPRFSVFEIAMVDLEILEKRYITLITKSSWWHPLRNNFLQSVMENWGLSVCSNIWKVMVMVGNLHTCSCDVSWCGLPLSLPEFMPLEKYLGMTYLYKTSNWGDANNVWSQTKNVTRTLVVGSSNPPPVIVSGKTHHDGIVYTNS